MFSIYDIVLLMCIVSSGYFLTRMSKSHRLEKRLAYFVDSTEKRWLDKVKEMNRSLTALIEDGKATERNIAEMRKASIAMAHESNEAEKKIVEYKEIIDLLLEKNDTLLHTYEKADVIQIDLGKALHRSAEYVDVLTERNTTIEMNIKNVVHIEQETSGKIHRMEAQTEQLIRHSNEELQELIHLSQRKKEELLDQVSNDLSKKITIDQEKIYKQFHENLVQAIKAHESTAQDVNITLQVTEQQIKKEKEVIIQFMDVQRDQITKLRDEVVEDCISKIRNKHTTLDHHLENFEDDFQVKLEKMSSLHRERLDSFNIQYNEMMNNIELSKKDGLSRIAEVDQYYEKIKAILKDNHKQYEQNILHRNAQFHEIEIACTDLKERVNNALEVKGKEQLEHWNSRWQAYQHEFLSEFGTLKHDMEEFSTTKRSEIQEMLAFMQEQEKEKADQYVYEFSCFIQEIKDTIPQKAETLQSDMRLNIHQRLQVIENECNESIEQVRLQYVKVVKSFQSEKEVLKDDMQDLRQLLEKEIAGTRASLETESEHMHQFFRSEQELVKDSAQALKQSLEKEIIDAKATLETESEHMHQFFRSEQELVKDSAQGLKQSLEKEIIDAKATLETESEHMHQFFRSEQELVKDSAQGLKQLLEKEIIDAKASLETESEYLRKSFHGESAMVKHDMQHLAQLLTADIVSTKTVLEKEVESMRLNIDSLKNRHNEYITYIDEDKKVADTLQKVNREMKMDMKKVEAATDGLQEKLIAIESIEKKLETLSEKEEALRDQVNTVANGSQELKQKIKEYEKTQKQIEKIDTKTSKVNDAMERLFGHEKRVEEVRRKMVEYTKLGKDVDDLEEKLETRLIWYRDAIDRVEMNQDKIENTQETLQSEVENTQEKIAELGTYAEKVEQNVTQVDNKLVQAKEGFGDIEEVQGKIIAIQKIIPDINKQYKLFEDKQGLIARAEQTFRQLNEQINTKIGTFKLLNSSEGARSILGGGRTGGSSRSEKELQDLQRQVIQLNKEYKWSNEEISRSLKIPIEAVQLILDRAMV